MVNFVIFDPSVLRIQCSFLDAFRFVSFGFSTRLVFYVCVFAILEMRMKKKTLQFIYGRVECLVYFEFSKCLNILFGKSHMLTRMRLLRTNGTTNTTLFLSFCLCLSFSVSLSLFLSRSRSLSL